MAYKEPLLPSSLIRLPVSPSSGSWWSSSAVRRIWITYVIERCWELHPDQARYHWRSTTHLQAGQKMFRSCLLPFKFYYNFFSSFISKWSKGHSGCWQLSHLLPSARSSLGYWSNSAGGYTHANIISSIKTCTSSVGPLGTVIPKYTDRQLHLCTETKCLCWAPSSIWQGSGLWDPPAGGSQAGATNTPRAATWLKKNHSTWRFVLLVGFLGFLFLKFKAVSSLEVFTHWMGILAPSRCTRKHHPRPVIFLPVLSQVQLLYKMMPRWGPYAPGGAASVEMESLHWYSCKAIVHTRTHLGGMGSTRDGNKHTLVSHSDSLEKFQRHLANIHPALTWASPRSSNFPPQAHSKKTNLNLWRISLVKTAVSLPVSSEHRLANRGGQTSPAFALVMDSVPKRVLMPTRTSAIPKIPA